MKNKILKIFCYVLVAYTAICLIHPSAAEPVAKGYSILLGLLQCMI